MHKKIEAELVSLAHSVLQMKNIDDISVLHKKAQEICEKLSVLKFVDTYMNLLPTTEERKEVAVNEKATIVAVETKEESISVVENLDEIKETTSQPNAEVEEVSGVEETLLKVDMGETSLFQNTLEEELKDAVSADVATQMFERVSKENPVIEEVPEHKQRSLNDTLFKNNIQIGLNDRIAFVKYLFEGNQEDFNRVLSQLNSFKTEVEAKGFMTNMVKPDYDWSNSVAYEQRFINLIERKFI